MIITFFDAKIVIKSQKSMFSVLLNHIFIVFYCFCRDLLNFVS